MVADIKTTKLVCRDKKWQDRVKHICSFGLDVYAGICEEVTFEQKPK